MKETLKIKAPKEDQEKKVKIVKFLSREEYEDHKAAISASNPVFKVYVPRSIDLVTDKKVCAVVTNAICWRPDIFLNTGCRNCILQVNCACPIKDIHRIPDNRPVKFKRAVMKAA